MAIGNAASLSLSLSLSQSFFLPTPASWLCHEVDSLARLLLPGMMCFLTPEAMSQNIIVYLRYFVTVTGGRLTQCVEISYKELAQEVTESSSTGRVGH
jgi:hypothetical protein